jgi:hypothetical protein
VAAYRARSSIVSAKEARGIEGRRYRVDNDGQITVSEYMNYQNATARDNTAAGTVRADQCQPDCGYVTLVDRYG